MSQVDTLSVMNRLLAILHRSLPQYLHEARPWHNRRGEQAAAALANIVDTQEKLVQRLAEFILDHGGQPEPGEYPLAFSDTNWHFVGLDYLLHPLVEHQRRDYERIQRCVDELTNDREARALAEEALGTALAHLESLEELASGTAE